MRNIHPKHAIKPLPYWVYFSTSFLLTLIGFATTLYLSLSHFRVYTDMGYKSFCAISRSINCDTVSQSAHAILLGMPLAVWGSIGYLFILVLLLYAWRVNARPSRMWAAIQVSTALFCIFDLYLAWISLYRINSACIMCILTYAVNFALLYFSWITRKRFNQIPTFACLKADAAHFRASSRKATFVLLVFITITVSGALFYPKYWQYELPPPAVNLSTGHTLEGQPWVGAEIPQLVIHEYSDYLCFQCAKMHSYLRELVNQYPDKIRLVHHHFPMDNAYNPLVEDAFHVGAGQMALLALYADESGKFWQMNDLLFEFGRRKEPVGMRKLAEMLDMDFKAMARSKQEPVLLKRLWSDIRSGMKYKVTATPSFIIKGKVYQGIIPAVALDKIIK
jgi:uncharacterized membrane protein/protein-disulfide isomerase